MRWRRQPRPDLAEQLAAEIARTGIEVEISWSDLRWSVDYLNTSQWSPDLPDLPTAQRIALTVLRSAPDADEPGRKAK